MADLMGYFIIGGILIAAVAVLYLPVFLILRGRVSVVKQLSVLLFAGASVIVLYATIFSAWGEDAFRPKVYHLNLIPLSWLRASAGMSEEKMLVQAVANIIMFIPFGCSLPFLFSRLRSFGRSTLIVFTASFMIEFVQYFLGASADIDDILLNVLGGITGYFLFAVLNRSLQRSMHTSRTGRSKA